MIAEEVISNKLTEYSFEVPRELIAQKPVEQRDNSRLLALDKKTGEIRHLFFKDILDYLNPGDCLILNKTKVIPSRIYGKKETGGKVEILFIEPKSQMIAGKYLALVKPFIAPGKKILLGDKYSVKIISYMPSGEALIEIDKNCVEELIEKFGAMPLPPYIKRAESDNLKEFDKERYQTVYAKETGSIAAPTAGLHFTNELIEKIKQKGVKIAEIILHVGRGTFKLIDSEDISKHMMLPEYYEIDENASGIINNAIDGGKKVFACGTTAVRAIESSAKKVNGSFKVMPSNNFTNIFIHPGYEFKVIDAILTNLHLPKSTPLMMVCAFAGKEAIFRSYKEAIEKKYRFFSYGDAMLII
ncbi:MAG: tRNA preQ1(34) S-adenosylmethionine ribosyltransferase-isomerase QueA [Elusimicrobia bacterium]|nr:tRNA preQ1(34) S-adenosylmethionine ribosyltransferase-isomerase QueA [Elusimicrobiota bacterium]